MIGTIFVPADASSAGMRVEAMYGRPLRSTPILSVMGTHGRSGLNRTIMGSVAEGVARRAPAPVMIVPPHRTDAL